MDTQLPADRLDQLALHTGKPTYLQNCLHNKHPNKKPPMKPETVVTPSQMGARLDADHPMCGVLIPCLFTRKHFIEMMRGTKSLNDQRERSLTPPRRQSAMIAVAREDDVFNVVFGLR